jgi:hypothetical protein
MVIRFHARPMLCALGVALLGLSGCNKSGSGDMAFARAAIERNSQLEIVAADEAASVFTVRVKDTGELRTVRTDEVIATLPGVEEKKPAVAPTPAVAPAPTPPPVQQTAEAAPPPPAEDFAQPGEEATPANAPAPVRTADVPVEPRGPGVISSGPGYTIKKGSAAPAERSSVANTSAPRTAAEHRYEPIICQGGRLLHIDNRNLEFEGDAVSAEDGCEIHITNSRISAKGVGIFARAANVHIKNSSIEGSSGSVEATNGAQVYVQSSTFKGISRRLDTATLHDLGGNVWN